jgi:hypothetical protein
LKAAAPQAQRSEAVSCIVSEVVSEEWIERAVHCGIYFFGTCLLVRIHPELFSDGDVKSRVKSSLTRPCEYLLSDADIARIRESTNGQASMLSVYLGGISGARDTLGCASDRAKSRRVIVSYGDKTEIIK